MFLLVIFETFRLFFKTLTADDKFFLSNSDNSWLPIPMELPKKRKMFSAFLPPFLKSTSNFKHLAKPTSTFKQFGTLSTFIPSLFPKLQTSKDFVRPMSKKPHYRTSFDSHFIKSSQTFVKSASKNFYHIFSSLWGKLS